ncbi:hypothetical protein [Roseibium album]|uniref:Uncharacterized protein n=1 Tax=Roseibium album TaxID=311410 RepID=A0A0M6ZMZ9_9HYPH|nr:hypothetical protein [Roseibium album]CTQ63500.1 hypothetical protein LA5094_06299 [Roseibium album]CTQ63674.1 hypothetical protein LA5095_00008 [Roseibium album]CTQ72198.1 hypothetical protein LA5096_03149 [Roseibium album]
MTIRSRPKRNGNYKPGPGRPPGRKNNKTLALEEAARKAAADIENAFEGDAHAFLQAVYRNPDMPIEIRIQAAGRALRVEKPVLSASRANVNVNVGFGERLEAARKRFQEIALQEAIKIETTSVSPPTVQLSTKKVGR